MDTPSLWQWLFGQSAFAVLAYILIQMLNQARDRELANIADYAKASQADHDKALAALTADERRYASIEARMGGLEEKINGLEEKLDTIQRLLEARRGSRNPG